MDPRRRLADAPACYQIRVRGAIDPHWSDWFDGLAIAYDAGGDTLLSGPLADQAALYGVLHRIRDLGLVLLAVTWLPEYADEAAP
ncbi:MAG: hypothetical protein IPO81_08340 [Kouleothrix sp.]|nr:hypothetical protein [Kouleothrix sp.]